MVGENIKVEGSGVLIEKEKLLIGKHVFIGRNFFIRAAGGVEIGDFTHISRNVTIHTAKHNIDGNLLPYDRDDIYKAVKIGRYVWIGMNVNILPGVIIGDGAVIGMGTTVHKDVPPNAIVVGAGQRIVGERDKKRTSLLASQGRFLKK